MADEQPAPAAVPKAVPKKCQACGHDVGKPHDENCIYRGTVEDATAV